MKNSEQELRVFLEALTTDVSEKEMLLSTLQAKIASVIISNRIRRDWSQQDLADALGVSQSLVSRWENGDNNYTLSTLVDIALTLDIEMCSPYLPSKSSVSGYSKIISFQDAKYRVAQTSAAKMWISSGATDELKEM